MPSYHPTAVIALERPSRRMPELHERPNRPPRTALYPEVVALSVKLRWVLVLAGALWLSVERPGPAAAWLLAGAAA